MCTVIVVHAKFRVDIVWKLLVLQAGSPAGIHGLFSGRYGGLAGRMVTLRVSMAGAKGVTTGTLVRLICLINRYWEIVFLYSRHHCVVMISILVTPRVFASAGCDRLVSEPLVIEKGASCGTEGDRIVDRWSDAHSRAGPAESGKDWLSKRKFVIVCHEKVVRISLESDEILRVHENVLKERLVNDHRNDKLSSARLSSWSAPVAKSPYRLAPLEMQELSEQLQELQDEELELLRKEKLYLRLLCEAVTEIEYPYDTIRDIIILNWQDYLPTKANVVMCYSKKERNEMKPRRVPSDGYDHSIWKIGESSLTGLELVQEMTDKVVLVKENPKAVRDRRRGEHVGPLEILERVGPVAYRLRLPEELSGIKVDKTLRFVEEPIEIMDREIRNMKRSKISLVKVH
ncbi:hypothetical protein Tco_0703887 [Tanacetum coccineum]|uniref:Tf2-1-like SH3-like domain-containing protein n=1 Tax=Tanacetum coccineum TaxID=301880 RepID=A0ABQ4Y101_9ASTR